MPIARIPAFAFPAVPDTLALFEAIALAGLEDRWIELSLADQRRILGAPVFWYSPIRVGSDGSLQVGSDPVAGNAWTADLPMPVLRDMVRCAVEAVAVLR